MISSSYYTLRNSSKNSDHPLELELLALKMAQSLSILTTDHHIVDDEKGGKHLATRRIDRDAMCREICADDICTITQIDPQKSCDEEYELIGEVIESCSSIARLDLITFWERVIFCWIIGDAHQDLLSFSLYEPHNELYSLAPLTTLSPLTTTPEREVALMVNGRVKCLRRADFAAAMNHSSLKGRAANLIFRKFTESQSRLCEMISGSDLDTPLREELLLLTIQRIALLKDE